MPTIFKSPAGLVVSLSMDDSLFSVIDVIIKDAKGEFNPLSKSMTIEELQKSLMRLQLEYSALIKKERDGYYGDSLISLIKKRTDQLMFANGHQEI